MDIIKNAKKDEEGFTGTSVKAIDEFFSAAVLRREKKTTTQLNGNLYY